MAVNDTVLALPIPPSVNMTRKVDWWGSQKVKRWAEHADHLLLKARYKPARIEQFELHITIAEGRGDLDNRLKSLIDYLRRIEAIVDDAPQNMRRITVELGEAPEGCRVRVVDLGGAPVVKE